MPDDDPLITYVAGPMRSGNVGPWVRSFAWRPRITADRGLVWLVTVWERRIDEEEYIHGGGDWYWQVRRFLPPS